MFAIHFWSSAKKVSPFWNILPWGSDPSKPYLLGMKNVGLGKKRQKPQKAHQKPWTQTTAERKTACGRSWGNLRERTSTSVVHWPRFFLGHQSVSTSLEMQLDCKKLICIKPWGGLASYKKRVIGIFLKISTFFSFETILSPSPLKWSPPRELVKRSEKFKGWSPKRGWGSLPLAPQCREQLPHGKLDPNNRHFWPFSVSFWVVWVAGWK